MKSRKAVVHATVAFGLFAAPAFAQLADFTTQSLLPSISSLNYPYSRSDAPQVIPPPPAPTPQKRPSASNGVVKSWACSSGLKRKGCETDYNHALSLTPVDSNTFRLTASGNTFTSDATAYGYAMRGAAQVTLAAGYDKFAILEQSDMSRTIVGSSGGGMVAGFNANGQAALVPGAPSTYSHRYPGYSMVVRMFHGSTSSEPTLNVFDAREVMNTMGVP